MLQKRERYVLMPARSVQPLLAAYGEPRQRALGALLTEQSGLSDVGSRYKVARPATRRISIDSGAKLVELTYSEWLTLQRTNSGVRALPVVYYDLAHVARLKIASRATVASAGMSPSLSINVIAADTATPIPGAFVTAFTNFPARLGDESYTDGTGRASLNLASSPTALDALLIYPPAGYWGYFARQVPLPASPIPLLPIDLNTPDFLQTVYGVAPLSAGAQVKVGVVDTGVDSTHPDLHIMGGAVFVTDENDAGTFGPVPAENGEHGTHVAGIIAGRGQAPNGKRGLAPASH